MHTYTDIERLEDVDPSPDDGSWGGSNCTPHGTYIGTPGGADYICGLCELGLNRWISDPLMGLVIGFGQPPVAGTRPHVTWRKSDPDIGERGIRKEAARLNEVYWSDPRWAGIDLPDLFFEVWQVEDGYWAK